MLRDGDECGASTLLSEGEGRLLLQTNESAWRLSTESLSCKSAHGHSVSAWAVADLVGASADGEHIEIVSVPLRLESCFSAAGRTLKRDRFHCEDDEKASSLVTAIRKAATGSALDQQEMLGLRCLVLINPYSGQVNSGTAL
eukprot:4395398-Pleurochrysis_carterae.AAC.2